MHFIIATPNKNGHLNTLVSNGKRFLAYDIVDRLRNTEQTHLLTLLANEVIPGDRKRGKLFQVSKPSFDARRILNEEMLFQKIAYIYHNPVSGKWNLVSDFVLYAHSSSSFYELGTPCQFPLTHYMEILRGR